MIHQTALEHPDEVLASAVLHRLQSSHSLDTNWQLAELPPGFKTPQYNFSGYFIALYAASHLVDALPAKLRRVDELRTLRLFSAACATAALIAIAAIAFTVSGGVGAVSAVALAALSPSLLMDGFYARPDTLVILLALLLLLVYLHRPRFGHAWIVIAGFLVGYLVSIKVSSLVYALLLVPAVARRGIGVREAMGAAVIATLATAAGFATGAPGALSHPAEFAAGVRALAGQYGTGFEPHGLGQDASLPERWGYAARWLWETWGLAPLLVVLGVVQLARERRWDALYGFAPFALTLAYFASTAVFFERNLGPALAAFAVLAGVGIEAIYAFLRARGKPTGARAAAAVAAVGMLAVPSFVSAKVLQAMYAREDVGALMVKVGRQFERDILVVGWSRPPWDALPILTSACDPPLVQIHHAGDRKTLAWLREGEARGWTQVYERPSRFAGFVPSAFHTYLSSGLVWYAKPGGRGGPQCGLVARWWRE